MSGNVQMAETLTKTEAVSPSSLSDDEASYSEQKPLTDQFTASDQDLSCVNPKLEEILQLSNPVGELIELAQRNSKHPPVFEIDEGQGPPHNKLFTCVAKFDAFDDIGKIDLCYII